MNSFVQTTKGAHLKQSRLRFQNFKISKTFQLKKHAANTQSQFAYAKRPKSFLSFFFKGDFFFFLFFSLKRDPRRRIKNLPQKKRERKREYTDTQTSILGGIPPSAMCVQSFDESRICNSHYVSHFAAFFIDARAKRSIAESCLSLKENL